MNPSSPIKISAVNWLVAVPLIVMSYHIYTFYETEPFILRIALAISFDLLVIAVFYFLKDEYISRSRKARIATWSALYLLIGFQLYVNVWAYWHLNIFRAVISGSIFPATVGLISYISMQREHEIDKELQKKQQKQQAAAKVQQADTEADWLKMSVEKPYDGVKVDKKEIIHAFSQDEGEISRDRFSGARNWRSVKRWWKKLTNGKSI